MDFSQAELGPKMAACSEMERKFAWAYVVNCDDNGAQAARDAGYSDAGEGCKVRAHELLHRERVLAAIEELGRKAFRGQLIPAIRANKHLIDNSKHPDHAGAVHKTLSRLGFGERTGVDVNVSGEVSVNHTDQALEDLRTLMGLGVPREKLVEVFGFSGLSRYEGMLAEQDARRPKLIKGEVNR
jgi:hypothetical protein